MSKYYTPSIEEFHVGFEYEYSGNKGKEWDADSIENLYDFEDLIDDIRYGDIRVKYLDKEDIESLGFVLLKAACSDLFFYEFELKTRWNYNLKFYNYIIPETELVPEQEIYSIVVKREDLTVFHGKIKNKSELKRLLKQLGINE